MSRILRLAICYDLQASAVTTITNERDGSRDTRLPAKSLEGPRARPVELGNEVGKDTAEVPPVEPADVLTFIAEIRRELHQCIHTDTLGEEVLAVVSPLLRQCEGNGLPVLEHHLRYDVGIAFLAKACTRQELFDAFLHRAERGAPCEARSAIATEVELLVPRR